MSAPLDGLSSIKVRLGALVAASVVAASLLTALGLTGGVPLLLLLPVSVALALGVTQLLAAGMTSPLRQMTWVARQMAQGDYSGRVQATSSDEVGQLARAFNQMAHDLATVDRERRDLIATVSHELRTPLTAMTAQLENLADGVVRPDRVHLQEALGQAERLRDLVGDLLEMSRLEAGVASLNLQEVGLRTLVERCAEDVRGAGREATFDVRIEPDLVVSADPARLRQLVTNVLDNAARHSPPGEPVVVSVNTAPSGWSLLVADQGPGVDPADRERVFERFGTDGSGGTGLGLAVSRWVAQLHGGTLRFVSPPAGTGALLILEIPMTPATKEATTVPSSAAPALPAPLGAPQGAVDSLFGRFWPEASTDHGWRTVLAALLAGVFGAMAMSFTSPGISWTLLLVVAGAAALVTARRRASTWTILCTVLAILLVLPMTLLSAWWIGMLGMLAAAAVFLSGLTGARSPLGILLTGLSWPLASLRGLPWFGRSLRIWRIGGLTPAVLRTVVLSVLALGVFGALFASADALFASWVDALVPHLEFGVVVARAFVGCGIFGLTLAAAYLGLNPPHVDSADGSPPGRQLQRFEWLVPVLVVDAVFLVFVLAQATSFFGGHAYLERTAGLTYADYVHQGFGQIVVATALTLLVVAVASRRAAPGDRRSLLASLGLLCVLALVVVASALYRMSLYQDAYGFTTLRLFVDVFEGWLGLVILVVMVAGVTGLGRWVPRFALVSGAVALLALAAINPEAWVAERNLDRYEATGKLDAGYLSSLSPDVVPVVIGRMPEGEAACILRLHERNALRSEVLDDPRAWNLGRERAAKAYADLAQPAGLDADRDPCADVWEKFDSESMHDR